MLQNTQQLIKCNTTLPPDPRLAFRTCKNASSWGFAKGMTLRKGKEVNGGDSAVG